MRARIDLHRQRRGPEWELVEAPLDLPQAIRDNDHENTEFHPCRLPQRLDDEPVDP